MPYLIKLGDRLMLIDTRAANLFGPTLAKGAAGLRTVGVKPEQIDAVLLTHMHPDHVGGAIDQHGKAVYSNAELIVSEADFRYWHDDAALGQLQLHLAVLLRSSRRHQRLPKAFDAVFR